jgi:hypothetical protein
MCQPIILIYIEVTARILTVLLAITGLGISIAVGVLPSSYRMDPGSLDDFDGEIAPPPAITFVCKFTSRQVLL